MKRRDLILGLALAAAGASPGRAQAPKPRLAIPMAELYEGIPLQAPRVGRSAMG